VRSPLNEGGTGAIEQDDADAAALYEQLEHHVLPCFFEQRGRWAEIMRSSISLNGSFFNTHRMVDQYRMIAYERFK
jgi:starch phosphorylase